MLKIKSSYTISALAVLLVAVSAALVLKTQEKFAPTVVEPPANTNTNENVNVPTIIDYDRNGFPNCRHDMNFSGLGLDNLKPIIDTELGNVTFSGNDLTYCDFNFYISSINGGEARFSIDPEKDKGIWSLSLPINRFKEGTNEAIFSIGPINGATENKIITFSVKQPQTNELKVEWLPEATEITAIEASALINKLLPMGDTDDALWHLKYYRIGKVKDGRYGDRALLNIVLPGLVDGPSFNPTPTVLAVTDADNNRLIVLGRDSSNIPLPKGLTAVSSIDGISAIPDLTWPPEKLSLASGYGLTRLIHDTPTNMPSSKTYNLLGRTKEGHLIYENQYGAPSVRMKNGEIIGYELTIPFYEAFKRIPDITWNDGSKNDADYYPVRIGGCGPSVYLNTVQSSEVAGKLAMAGITSNGESIYMLKNSDDKLLKDMYENWFTYSNDKPSYGEFTSRKPILFWKDPFGRWVKWNRADTMFLGECAKPVVYLYPTQTEQVSVKLGSNIEVTKSEPIYTNGWKVAAEPNGTLTTADGATYPYLYWDGNGASYDTPTTGFVVASKDIEAALSSKLATLGLNEKEIADFNEFWVPIVSKSPYALISFVPQNEWSKAAPLAISPAPDTVIRVFMDWKPLSAPIEIAPQALPPTPVRTGFTAVEWGGLLYK